MRRTDTRARVDGRGGRAPGGWASAGVMMTLLLGGSAGAQSPEEAPAPGQATVTVTLLDDHDEDGALLGESEALQLSLADLESRLENLSAQARALQDGEMLACLRELQVGAIDLGFRNQEAHKTLLLATSEEDPSLRQHGMRMTEIIRARARSIDLAEDECQGGGGVYVERQNTPPVWEQTPE